MKTFTKLNQEHHRAILGFIDTPRVHTGLDIPDEFGHDELSTKSSAPELVVQPISTEEVSQIMKFANHHKIPVTVRGQGTGLVGGCVPLFGGILLDMQKMNRILELDRENMTLTVEPGVLLMEVTQFVEAQGLFYPPDPGEKTASIGGNISTNAGGMRAVKYGVTRDYVRGLEVVTATGQILQLGGKIVKNSSGYALKDLIVGSEGTLAVITKAVLRLLPKPKESISLLVPFTSLQTAIEAVPQILHSGLQPVAVEFLERETLQDTEKYLGKSFPDSKSPAYLLLSFDGNDREIMEKTFSEAAEVCLSAGASDVFLADTQERKDGLWTARGAFLEAIKASADEIDECDVVVPRNQVASFMSFAHSLEEAYHLPIRGFGHAGDGNLHIYVLRNQLSEDAWMLGKNQVMKDLYDKAQALLGQVSGEHGIGYDKISYLSQIVGSENIRLMQGIRKVFDPKGILNPGKLFEENHNLRRELR